MHNSFTVNKTVTDMAKLLISTQYMENYGDEDQPYWKYKGGSEYVVCNVPLDSDKLKAIVEECRKEAEWDNTGSRSWIISWEVVADDYLTEFERSQLEYDGRITYPAREIKMAIPA